MLIYVTRSVFVVNYDWIIDFHAVSLEVSDEKRNPLAHVSLDQGELDDLLQPGLVTGPILSRAVLGLVARHVEAVVDQTGHVTVALFVDDARDLGADDRTEDPEIGDDVQVNRSIIVNKASSGTFQIQLFIAH